MAASIAPLLWCTPDATASPSAAQTTFPPGSARTRRWGEVQVKAGPLGQLISGSARSCGWRSCPRSDGCPGQQAPQPQWYPGTCGTPRHGGDGGSGPSPCRSGRPARQTGTTCRGAGNRGYVAHLTWAHGQQRTGAVQRLDLGLFVHAQHQRPARRTQIEPHDVAHLLDEERVRLQLEALGAVRLQSGGTPDTADGFVTRAAALGHGPGTQMGSVPTRGLRRQRDHTLHIVIGNRTHVAGRCEVRPTTRPVSVPGNGNATSPPFRRIPPGRQPPRCCSGLPHNPISSSPAAPRLAPPSGDEATAPVFLAPSHPKSPAALVSQ